MVDMLAAIVEFFGTFLFLMSILATGNAFMIGATLAVIILLTGSISGAHVNPAVTLTMFIKGAITAPDMFAYMAVQFAGGVAAYYAYTALV